VGYAKIHPSVVEVSSVGLLPSQVSEISQLCDVLQHAAVLSAVLAGLSVCLSVTRWY